MDDTTPRSQGYSSSPRDDRFYTPRTIARSNSNSNSEEWASPRFETPRYSATPRSDGEYATPRIIDYSTPRTTYRKSQSTAGGSRETTPRERSPRLDPSSAAAPKGGGPMLQGAAGYFQQKGTVSSSGAGVGSGYKYSQQGDSYDRKYSHQSSAVDDRDIEAGDDMDDTLVAENKNYYDNISGGGGGGGHYQQHSPNRGAKHDGVNVGGDRDELADEMEYISQSMANAGLGEQDIEDVFSFARHGRIEEVDRMIEKGMPVDVRDGFGNTLLIIACQNGNKRVAKQLLRRGANINTRNHKGNTPLHYCYHYGYGETLGEYIISKGASTDAQNKAGKPYWDGI